MEVTTEPVVLQMGEGGELAPVEAAVPAEEAAPAVEESPAAPAEAATEASQD